MKLRGLLMPSDETQVVEEANSLIEMYKAGFLDGYKVKGKVRSKKDHIILNDFYKKAFIKRFERKINKILKKKKK